MTNGNAMLRLTESVYNQIKETIGNIPPEHGGVLGSGDGITITDYYYDYSGFTSSDSYCPDCNKINAVLENEWAVNNVYLAGVVHSHDSTCDFPSCGDIAYAEKIMQSAEMEHMYLPIVITKPFRVIGYSVKLVNGIVVTNKEHITIV